MKRPVAALLTLIALTGPVLAGSGFSLENRVEAVYPGPKGGRVHVSPFPMSKRTASVLLSEACWKDCSSQGAWRLEACLRTTKAGQDACRASLDADDRTCLRQCRTDGGPLLNITDY